MAIARNITLSRQLSLSQNSLDRVLAENYANTTRLQEMVATGKKIARASDDPASYSLAERLDRTSARYDQYQRSVTSASVWSAHTQDTLDNLAELYTQAYEQGVQAANDSVDQPARDMIADRLAIVFEQVIDELNNKTPDGYLFAGTATETKPFLQDASGTADGAGVTYYGSANALERLAGPDLRLDVTISGSDVIDTGAGYTVTEALDNLITAIRSGDTADMDTAIGEVTTARDHLIDKAASSGVTAERLSTIAEQLSAAQLRATEQHSQIADADLAETIIAMQRAQTGLQAALQSIGSMTKLTLLDYLR